MKKNNKLIYIDDNTHIILAGISTLILGMGIARFSFTALLPSMLSNFLDVSMTGILASMNYLGYLVGAICAMFIRKDATRVILFKIGILFCILSTLILAINTNLTIWLISRLFAGIGSSFIMVLGSAIVFNRLTSISKIKLMGIYFSGVGFSIVITSLMSELTLLIDNSWQSVWYALFFFSLPIAIYAIYILEYKSKYIHISISSSQSVISQKIFISIFIFAYFLEGIGFTVQATFLPNMVDSIDGLEGYGRFIWLLVGITSIPSAIIWTRLAHQYGSLNMIILALFIQALGIILPSLTDDLYLNILSGISYGSTMVGLTALFMNYGGELFPHNPTFIMGALTSSYGIGQIIAPLYCIYFFKLYGSYNIALFVTSACVLMGMFLLLVIKYLKQKETNYACY